MLLDDLLRRIDGMLHAAGNVGKRIHALCDIIIILTFLVVFIVFFLFCHMLTLR